jgi:hypothetical protein
MVPFIFEFILIILLNSLNPSKDLNYKGVQKPISNKIENNILAVKSPSIDLLVH